MKHFTIFNVFLYCNDNEEIFNDVLLTDELMDEIVNWYKIMTFDILAKLKLSIKKIKIRKLKNKIKINFYEVEDINILKEHLYSFIHPDLDLNLNNFLTVNGREYSVYGCYDDAEKNLDNHGIIFDKKDREKHINETNSAYFYENLPFTKILKINYHVPDNLWDILPKTVEKVEIINLNEPIEIPDLIKDLKIKCPIEFVKFGNQLEKLEYIYPDRIIFNKGFLPTHLNTLILRFVEIEQLELPLSLKNLHLTIDNYYDLTNLPPLENLILNSRNKLNIDFLPITLKKLTIYDYGREENENYNFSNLHPSIQSINFEGYKFDKSSIPENITFNLL